MMQIGVPKEILADETRVATTPKTAASLLKLGFGVAIEKNAGIRAGFHDSDYEAAGVSVVSNEKVWQSDIILKVNAPQVAPKTNADEFDLIKAGATVISFIWPAQNKALLDKLSGKKINVLAMDAVPRISRAQSLDALSAMTNIAGYRAVIEAAYEFGRVFNGQMTAAGKTPPAKVLVVGAGVAGLAAISAAGNLGAAVRAFDVRAEVREQIESMGAEFLEADIAEDAGTGTGYAKETSDEFNKAAERLYAKQAKEVDIIITTALIPGRPAPRLISKAMADSMKTGGVIVDLAAANGGNCEYTVADKIITTASGVKVVGYTNLACRLPAQSSQLYGTTLLNLLKLLYKNGNFNIDFDDEVQRALTVIRDGKITWPAPPIKVSVSTSPPQEVPPPVKAKPSSPLKKYAFAAAGLVAFGALAAVAPAEIFPHFMVFMLACVAGFYVVWNVSHAHFTRL